MFCVFLRSFRSVLAKNPAILSSDGRERHFFFLVQSWVNSWAAAPGNEVVWWSNSQATLFMKTSPRALSQSETVKYFEWIIIFIIGPFQFFQIWEALSHFLYVKLAEELSQSENTKSWKWLINCCKNDMVCHLSHAILFFLSLVVLFTIVDDSFFGVVLHDSRKL